MKCNQWTLGLAAVGLVSLASVAQADSTNMVMTAVSTTTLSGFVDTSVQWNFGSGNANNPSQGFGGAGKADGFNLNVVDLNLEKDADASDGWGAGYKAELWMGPDANTLATQSGGKGDFAVKNAYVDLKAPLGSGLEIKIGVFDTPIGYEVADSVNNPNFTRSYGFGIEPTTHTGVLATYTVCEMLSVSGGVADTFGPAVNGRSLTSTGTVNESYKTYIGSATFTASTNWGWVGGSSLTAVIINGFNAGAGPGTTGSATNTIGRDQTSLYVGASINTPLTALKLGTCYDYVLVDKQALTQVGPAGGASSKQSAFQNAVGLYATYQVTEKLSLNTRGEYFSQSKSLVTAGSPASAIEITETAQYDLWKNVMSRLEFRWDHANNGSPAGAASPFYGGATVGSGTLRNSFDLIASIAYKF